MSASDSEFPSSLPAPNLTGLLGPLLAAVSRTFYLSLRFLPSPVRLPMSLGYLLARGADTVADVSTRPAEERLALLGELRDAVNGGPGPDLAARLAALAPEIGHAGERELLRRLPECFAALGKLSDAERELVKTVMDRILRGMELDLRRFPEPEPLRALRTVDELEEYTWLVAGCVGEFWTEICLLKLPGVSKLPREELLALAKRYGQGLQLINILRDQPGDAKIGRCYLPEESLRAAGLEGPVRWPAEDWTPWHAVRKTWLAEARARLDAGREYAKAIRSARLRFAALMPLLIGAETLTLLELQPETGPPQAVKIPRDSVKRHIRRAMWLALNDRSLAKL